MSIVRSYDFTVDNGLINASNGQVGRELEVSDLGRKTLVWNAGGGDYRLEFSGGPGGAFVEIDPPMTGTGALCTETIALAAGNISARFPHSMHTIRIRTVTAGIDPRADLIGHSIG